jgi:hypothetical protein
MSIEGGQMEGCQALEVASSQVSAMVEENFHTLDAAAQRCHVESGAEIIIAQVDLTKLKR